MPQLLAASRVVRAVQVVEQRQGRIIDELREFLHFPTVAAEPEHARDMQTCARWLAAHLRMTGFPHAEVHQTSGHPIVYGHTAINPHFRTVVIYGHYDVQPADPIHEWVTPPFRPSIRAGNLYARGAADDKGQLFLHVKAIEAMLRANAHLPLNVHLVFEGEEETGSMNLLPWLRKQFEGKPVDAAVISDMSIPGPDQPAITYGLRGALSSEIHVTGPRQDLHSGVFGGAVHNPIHVLCDIIARLHDSSGRIAIPGFYDRVGPITHAERRYMARHNPSDRQILKEAGVRHGRGEDGFTAYERIVARPSLSVSGISGGYTRAGTKAIIPARASAKVGFRLTPEQDPDEVFDALEKFVRKLTPPSVTSSIRKYFAARPALVDPALPVIRAAARAYETSFGRPPVLLRSGGTIPVAAMFQDLMHAPVVMMGFALPDANLHGPNERLHLRTFFRGIHTSIAFLNECAEMRT